MKFARLLAQLESKAFVPSHWLWAVLALLLVAALSFRQLDIYPPSHDEFFSMYNAGWLINSPYSPADVLNSLIQYSPNHTPGYFLLLNLWGNTVGYDVALGRLLSVFGGLLSLAMVYRLGRDFIAPAAAFIALVLLASNAFYNFFLAYVRMFTLIVLFSSLLLWLYLRFIHQSRGPKTRDYFALFATSYVLLNLHVSSGFFFVMLGTYHLIAAPKNRRWIIVSFVFVLAFLLFSPWLLVLVNQGLVQTLADWTARTTSAWQIIEAWLTVVSNGSILLLFLALIGLLLGQRLRASAIKSYYLLVWIFMIVLGLAAAATDFISINSMRLTLSVFPAVILWLGASLYALCRIRRSLGLLMLIAWGLSGLHIQQNTNWYQFEAAALWRFWAQPWHAVSRHALKSNSNAPITAYRFGRALSEFRAHIAYSPSQLYFGRHGIRVHSAETLEQLDYSVRLDAVTMPAQRIVFSADSVTLAERAAILQTLDAAGYQLCHESIVGLDTTIHLFMWDSVDCKIPLEHTSYQTDLIDYSFFATKLDGAALRFVDRRTANTAFDEINYNMSYQLISDDWRNVAQLDLPLVAEGELRQFSLDISQVSPGTYRLMLILYSTTTGERIPWEDNPGYIAEMLPLSEVNIPGP